MECVELPKGCRLLWPRRRGSCAEEHCRGGYIKGTVSAGDPGVAMAEGMIGCLNGEYKDHELVVMAGTEVTPANIGDFYKA